MVVARDISERKRTEAALCESRELFSTFLDNWPSPILLKGTDGRFRIVNKRYQEWYGIAQEQSIGKTFEEIKPTSPIFIDTAWLDRDRTVVETGAPVEHETEVTFQDGSRRLLTVSKFPVFDGDGTIIGIGQFHTDITAQRLLEAQLREAHRLEAVGLLTGGVAHEFNNLLLVITGNLEMSLQRITEPEVRVLLSTAMWGVSRGAELTRHLLAFSRKQDLKSESVALNDLVIRTSDFLGRTIGATITLTTDLADDLWPATTDPAQVEAALLNLCLNARDAMPDGGTLTLRTGNNTVDAEDAEMWPDASPGDFVVVEVADDGEGMTEETLERAFEPFYTTKDVGEGSGLGLSVVYGFARQSDGFVHIESELGAGTSVRLYLPRSTTDEMRPRHDKRPLEAPRRGNGTILVVEDDPDVRQLVVALIEDLGYTTIAAEDGEKALARLDENPDIDLLFIDIVLTHGMGGIDNAREARRRRAELKIIYTSGYPDQAIDRMGEIDDEFVFVAKPYTRNALADAIATVMRS